MELFSQAMSAAENTPSNLIPASEARKLTDEIIRNKIECFLKKSGDLILTSAAAGKSSVSAYHEPLSAEELQVARSRLHALGYKTSINSCGSTLYITW